MNTLVMNTIEMKLRRNPEGTRLTTEDTGVIMLCARIMT